jgi:hypothetical protein
VGRVQSSSACGVMGARCVQAKSPWTGLWSGENYTKDELLWLAAEIGVGVLCAAVRACARPDRACSCASGRASSCTRASCDSGCPSVPARTHEHSRTRQDGKAVTRLVSAGARVNSANLASQTALHKCVKFNLKEKQNVLTIEQQTC